MIGLSKKYLSIPTLHLLCPSMVLCVILPCLTANPFFMTKTKIYWLCQITGWLGMVAIEIINFTFFIVGKFSLEYLLFFLLLAFVGIVLTHALKLLLARLNFFKTIPLSESGWGPYCTPWPYPYYLPAPTLASTLHWESP